MLIFRGKLAVRSRECKDDWVTPLGGLWLQGNVQFGVADGHLRISFPPLRGGAERSLNDWPNSPKKPGGLESVSHFVKIVKSLFGKE